MKINPGILNADYKVAGGKLLRVKLILASDDIHQYISSISIYGDFFMHPESAIEELEQALTGVKFEKDAVHKIVTTFLHSGIEVIGAAPEDFTHTIMIAK